MKVGVMLPQEWDNDQVDPQEAYETMTQVAQEAEALGFTSIWLFDHFHSTVVPQKTKSAIFECWTSTAALARDTTRIRIGQMATCNSFRHPALLAKMASTVDVLSHGRLELGLGAGWNEQEYLAYGYRFPDIPTRLRQLREALQVIRAMWTEETASFEGKYVQIHGAINQPKGAQKPHIPLLVAGKGEQVTLQLVARYGDACNFTHPTLEEIEQKFTRLKSYCEAIGRDDREIRRTIYINAFLGETEAEALMKATQVPSKRSLDQIRRQGLLGTPTMVRQRFEELEQAGVQEVIVFLHDVAHMESLHLLAQGIHS